MSDEDMKESAGMMMTGIFLYALYGIAVIILTVVIISPFATLYFLDKFVNWAFNGNALFFSLLFVFLLFVKLFINKFSVNIFVRVLFDLYIIVLLLYFFLYIVHFDTVIYTYFRIIIKYFPNSDIFDIYSKTFLQNSTNGTWFYNAFAIAVDKFVLFTKQSFANVLSIDHSCFEVPFSQIDIIITLKTVVLYFIIGGFTFISVVFCGTLILATALITIVLPYFISFLLLILINKLIYRFNAKILFISKKKLNERKIIKIDSLKQIIKNKDGFSSKFIADNYKDIALSGNPLAQFLYAQCLYHGENETTVNKSEAIKWYKASAFSGLPESMFMLAGIYFEGKDLARNKSIAKTYLDVAMKSEEFKESYYTDDNFKNIINYIRKKTKFSDCF